MPKLYHFYWRDRGGRVKWLLEEMGIEYSAQLLNYKTSEHHSDWYKKINPNCRAPALEDDGQVILETGAIFYHLFEKYPQSAIVPKDSGKKHRWMFYAANTLEPFFWQAHILTRVPDSEERRVAHDFLVNKLDTELSTLREALKDSDYLLGEFSGLDIMVGESLRYCKSLLSENDTIVSSYLSRLWQRPAFEKVRSIGPQQI